MVIISSCGTSGGEVTQYGEDLTLSETTSVSAILAEPEAYIGQQVLVEGTVVDVCEKRGCWLAIAGDGDGEQIRVKVEDGVIVFPMDARGLQARVEGVVEKLEFTMEETLERARHQAEEHGTEFDPSKVTGPETIYQLKGLGAVIGNVS
jgi:hypothetical protein